MLRRYFTSSTVRAGCATASRIFAIHRSALSSLSSNDRLGGDEYRGGAHAGACKLAHEPASVPSGVGMTQSMSCTTSSANGQHTRVPRCRFAVG